MALEIESGIWLVATIADVEEVVNNRYCKGKVKLPDTIPLPCVITLAYDGKNNATYCNVDYWRQQELKKMEEIVSRLRAVNNYVKENDPFYESHL